MTKLAVAVAVGFFCGWLFFDVAVPQPRSERAPPRAEDQDADAKRGTTRSTDARNKTTGPETRPEDEPKATRNKREKPTVELVAELKRAQQKGSWRDYRRVLNLLGGRNDKIAHAELIAVMGDPTVDLKDFLGAQFHNWLSDCTLPKIAAAARARHEKLIKRGETSWTSAKGWFELVADHGTESDLAWLRARADRRRGQHASVAVEALASSSNPLVIPHVRDLVAEGHLRPRHLEAFARAHPTEAFHLLDGLVAKGAPSRAVLSAYVTSVDPKRLASAKRRLLMLRDREVRIRAVYAVGRLEKRGHEVADLRPLLDAPLEAIAAPGKDLSSALYSIEYNPKLMWTTATRDALRSAEGLLGSYEKRRVEVLKMIEARLSSAWKD